MRAVVVRHDCQARMELAEVTEPIAGPDDVLVGVDYIALDPGELHYMESAADGAHIGWDFTGRVARTAQNCPRPAEGVPIVRSPGSIGRRSTTPQGTTRCRPTGTSRFYRLAAVTTDWAVARARNSISDIVSGKA